VEISLMAFLLSLPGKIAIAALVLVLAYGAGEWHGRSAASANGKLAAAENTARILKKRGVIDDQVSILDAADLCASYGLPDDQQAECVRRLREADAEPGDVGIHQPH
jgi:hypothetical protein